MYGRHQQNLIRLWLFVPEVSVSLYPEKIHIFLVVRAYGKFSSFAFAKHLFPLKIFSLLIQFQFVKKNLCIEYFTGIFHIEL